MSDTTENQTISVTDEDSDANQISPRVPTSKEGGGDSQSDTQSMEGLAPSSLEASPAHSSAQCSSESPSPAMMEVNKAGIAYEEAQNDITDSPNTPKSKIFSDHLELPSVTQDDDDTVSSTTVQESPTSATSPTVTSPSPSTSNSSSVKSVRDWGFSTLKFTKQMLQEKLKLVHRTMDPILENKIDTIRENQLRYQQIIDTVQRMIDGLQQAFQAQALLGDMFLYMSHKQSALNEEFSYNAQTQKVISANGQLLLVALESFIKDLRTLSDKSTSDYLDTVRKFEHARTEFDMYRLEWESAQQQLQQQTANNNANSKLTAKVKESEDHKVAAQYKYEQLKEDVECKSRLLEDNRNRVLQKQLLLFHNAVAAFFSGNEAALNMTLQQFALKSPMSPSASVPGSVNGSTATSADFVNLSAQATSSHSQHLQ